MGKLGTTLILCVLSCLVANAADITTGYSFSSGEQNVTHTKLNNAVNNATINTGFYTDKAATTTPQESDLALIYQGSSLSFKKITLGNLFLNSSALITNKTADATPSSSDFILTYDVSAEALRKATLLNAFFENDALINARTNWSNPDPDVFFLGYNGDWSKVARTNLFRDFWRYQTSAFTNLAVHTAPTNSDALVIHDSVSGTNRQLPLINLFSNLPPVSSINSTDVFPAVVGGEIATVPYGLLREVLQPAGQTIGFVYTNITNAVEISEIIPFDDTIPQNTEGAEVLVASITPQSATSLLQVKVEIPVIAGATGIATVALFRDGASDAIAAGWDTPGNVVVGGGLLQVTHIVAAGSTNSTTFRARVGTSNAAITVNGFGGTRRLGGALSARMFIQEIRQ